MGLQSTMLESVATIFRPSSTTRDARQGTVQVFTILQAAMACSQQQMSASIQDLYLQRGVVVGTTLYFFEDPSATVNDLVSCTDDATQTNSLYLVQGNATSDTRGFLWLLDVQQVNSPDAPPTVVNPTYASVTTTTAVLGATVTSNGASALTGSGIVYSKTSLNAWPRIGGANVTQLAEGSPAVGAISQTASGLLTGTRYSFTAYATNGVATTYATVTEFVTL